MKKNERIKLPNKKVIRREYHPSNINKITRDNNLTSNSKILLIEILSDRDDWDLSRKNYLKRLEWAPKTFNDAIVNLEENGYIRRTKILNTRYYFYTISEYGNLTKKIKPGDTSTEKGSDTPQEEIKVIKSNNIEKQESMKRVTKTRAKELVNKLIVEKKMTGIKSKDYKIKDIKSQFNYWLDELLIDLEKEDRLYLEEMELLIPDMKKKLSNITRDNRKRKTDHETEVFDSHENSN